MTQDKKQQIFARAEKWFDKIVPATGAAKTKGGEVMRAAMRLHYRYYNDGDTAFEEYGITTCWSSWAYLMDEAPQSMHDIVAGLQFVSSGNYDCLDEYDNTLHLILDAVCDWLDSNADDCNTPNTEDCIVYAIDDRPTEVYDGEDDYD